MEINILHIIPCLFSQVDFVNYVIFDGMSIHKSLTFPDSVRPFSTHNCQPLNIETNFDVSLQTLLSSSNEQLQTPPILFGSSTSSYRNNSTFIINLSTIFLSILLQLLYFLQNTGAIPQLRLFEILCNLLNHYLNNFDLLTLNL